MKFKRGKEKRMTIILVGDAVDKFEWLKAKIGTDSDAVAINETLMATIHCLKTGYLVINGRE